MEPENIINGTIKLLTCRDCGKNSNETLFKRQKKRCQECFHKGKADYYQKEWKSKYYKYQPTGTKRGRPKKVQEVVNN